MSIVYTAMLI